MKVRKWLSVRHIGVRTLEQKLGLCIRCGIKRSKVFGSFHRHYSADNCKAVFMP